MEEGILNIQGVILYFVVPGITSIPLQHGVTLEIYLGDYWIAGTFNLHKKGVAAPIELRLSCKNHAERPSFCGLLSGMTARVDLEELLNASLPPEELVGHQHLEVFPQTTWESEEAQEA